MKPDILLKSVSKYNESFVDLQTFLNSEKKVNSVKAKENERLSAITRICSSTMLYSCAFIFLQS